MQAQLSHQEAKGLFLAALDEELAARDQARLHAHLDQCGDCRTGYQRYAQVVSRVQSIERERAPQQLSTVIMRRVRRRRLFGARGLALAHAQYRVPVEAIIPVLLGVLMAAFLVLSAG